MTQSHQKRHYLNLKQIQEAYGYGLRHVQSIMVIKYYMEQNKATKPGQYTHKIDLSRQFKIISRATRWMERMSVPCEGQRVRGWLQYGANQGRAGSTFWKKPLME